MQGQEKVCTSGKKEYNTPWLDKNNLDSAK